MKLFAENRNVKVVDDIEVIMRPKARLSEGMAGRIQASARTMLTAGRKHGIHKCYLNGSEKGQGNVNTRPRTFLPFVCEE